MIPKGRIGDLDDADEEESKEDGIPPTKNTSEQIASRTDSTRRAMVETLLLLSSRNNLEGEDGDSPQPLLEVLRSDSSSSSS
mmetsp:Transcript_10689/g.23171  ORF Transcript_10689/g.23171 Transcript_10689/m.23171 type:complete len:82 (+) Transcript_10689:999-1244(+)